MTPDEIKEKRAALLAQLDDLDAEGEESAEDEAAADDSDTEHPSDCFCPTCDPREHGSTIGVKFRARLNAIQGKL